MQYRKEDKKETVHLMYGNQLLHMYFLCNFSYYPQVVNLKHFAGSGRSIQLKILFGTVQDFQINSSNALDTQSAQHKGYSQDFHK